jgi:hypothetical protein
MLSCPQARKLKHHHIINAYLHLQGLASGSGSGFGIEAEVTHACHHLHVAETSFPSFFLSSSAPEMASPAT